VPRSPACRRICLTIKAAAADTAKKQKVFMVDYPTPLEVGLFDSILQSNGIPTVIKNQNLSSLAGDMLFTTIFPELWVLDDNYSDQAVALLQNFRQERLAPSTASDWTCTQCGESVPGNFDTCWNCETPRFPEPAAAIAP
jgi:hypothetical protein